MRLKICDSHLRCKVANNCLNVRERVEVVDGILPSPAVSCQCPWKKTLIEKRNVYSHGIMANDFVRRWKNAFHDTQIWQCYYQKVFWFFCFCCCCFVLFTCEWLCGMNQKLWKSICIQKHMLTVFQQKTSKGMDFISKGFFL